MNREQIELEPVEVERFQVKEVLKTLLHSIIFQRALGEVRMRDAESELFEISYPRCDSRLVEQKVEEQAETFSSAFERALERVATVRTKISISFFERRSRPAAFGLFRSEERVVWERWNIPMQVYSWDPAGTSTGQGHSGSDPERTRRRLELEGALRQRLEFILTMASGKTAHIPPADGLGGDVPWFEIASDAADSWSGLDLFKQLLSSPPQLLSNRGP